MFTVYAIWNPDHNKVYIGQTQDISERLEMHNTHTLEGYTSRFSGTWKLIYQENADSRTNALIREKQLKSFRGREFIRTYIP